MKNDSNRWYEDKFVRSIKTNPNLKINNDLKNELPKINMPQINNNLQPNIQDSSNFNAPQSKTQQFNNVFTK